MYLKIFAQMIDGCDGQYQISKENFERFLIETRQLEHRKAFAQFCQKKLKDEEQPFTTTNMQECFDTWRELPHTEQNVWLGKVSQMEVGGDGSENAVSTCTQASAKFTLLRLRIL